MYGKRTLKGNARRLEGKKNAFAFYVTRGEPFVRSDGTRTGEGREDRSKSNVDDDDGERRRGGQRIKKRR